MTTTKAETTHTAITALMATGASLADAVRTVAAETGAAEGAVRANYYNHRRKLQAKEAPPRRARADPGGLSIDEAIGQARELLTRALDGIEQEVAAAQQQMEAARERYEALAASAPERAAEVQRKIAALGGTDDGA